MSSTDDEMTTEWQEVVEQCYGRDRVGTPAAMVRVCTIHHQSAGDCDVSVGDQLLIHQVRCLSARLHLLNQSGTDDSNANYVTVPVTCGVHFTFVPRHSTSHVFNSVRDVIDAYPAVSDAIFAMEDFDVPEARRTVRAYEKLEIVAKINSSDPDGEKLCVLVMRPRKQLLLLPQSLQVAFMQTKPDATTADSYELRRTYNISELSHHWSINRHPMRIKFHTLNNGSPKRRQGKHGNHPSWTSKMQRAFRGRHKDEKQARADDDVIPLTWRDRVLAFEPMYTAYVTHGDADPSTAKTLTMPDHLRMKVYRYSDVAPAITSSAGEMSEGETGDDEVSEVTGPSEALSHVDVSSLSRGSSSLDAIVAVVTQAARVTSSQNYFAPNDWIAMHRTKHVRKLLMTSSSKERRRRFLVSEQHGGTFVTRPTTYELAGQVPCGDGQFYHARSTAHSSHPGLDGCMEGEVIQFMQRDERTLDEHGSIVEVVHCLVSSWSGGVQHAVVLPATLPGCFQLVRDGTGSRVTASDLVRTSLPVSVTLQAPHPAVSGRDPLQGETELLVEAVVPETTVIAERLRFDGDTVVGTGDFYELTVARSSLCIRRVAGDRLSGTRGAAPKIRHPRAHVFPGYRFLPTVEEITVDEERNLQVVKPPHLCEESPSAASTPSRQPSARDVTTATGDCDLMTSSVTSSMREMRLRRARARELGARNACNGSSERDFSADDDDDEDRCHFTTNPIFGSVCGFDDDVVSSCSSGDEFVVEQRF